MFAMAVQRRCEKSNSLLSESFPCQNSQYLIRSTCLEWENSTFDQSGLVVLRCLGRVARDDLCYRPSRCRHCWKDHPLRSERNFRHRPWQCSQGLRKRVARGFLTGLLEDLCQYIFWWGKRTERRLVRRKIASCTNENTLLMPSRRELRWVFGADKAYALLP